MPQFLLFEGTVFTSSDSGKEAGHAVAVCRGRAAPPCLSSWALRHWLLSEETCSGLHAE